MTIIEKKLANHRNEIAYVQKKIDIGCSMYALHKKEDTEAAFEEAFDWVEGLLKSHPGNLEYHIVKAEACHLLALGYLHIREYKKARLYVLKAFEAITKSRECDPWYEVTLRSTLARIEQGAKHYRKAVQILEEVNSFCRDNDFGAIKEDEFLYGNNMLSLAVDYRSVNDYAKMVKTTEDIIELRRKYPDGYYNRNPNEYLSFLTMVEEEAAKHDDGLFRCEVLSEGIAYCEDSKERGKEFHALKEGEFYQHLLHQKFLDHDWEALEQTYHKQIKLCDENEEDAMDKVRVITHLNYAVYCSILKEAAKAQQAVEEALGCCMKLKDDGGMENTMFLVSALSTLSNLAWDNGDIVSALRDIDTEVEIITNYEEQHTENLQTTLPIHMDIMYNQAILRYELGKVELAEQDIELLKTRYRVNPEKATRAELASALTVMKRCGDIHQEVKKHQKALEEYQEAIYLIESTDEDDEDIKNMLDDIHKELEKAIIMEKKELNKTNF